MPFDGFMTGYLCCELNELLKNAKINKIYQTSANDILFEIYAPVKGNIRLRVCANSSFPHISLTNLSDNNPFTPPAFCMLLRKHLLGGKIKAVSQSLHDRIVTIEIEQPDEIGDFRTRHLIIELTGRNSNIIIADENFIIIDCLKKIDESKSSVRHILPKLEYLLPPSDKLNPYTMRKSQFVNALNSSDLPADKNIVRIIDGASNAYAQYLLTGNNINESNLYERIVNSMNTPDEYYIFEKDGIYKDLYFTDIYTTDASIKKHKYSCLIDLCTEYYDFLIENNKLNDKILYLKSILSPLIKRASDKLNKLSKELSLCTDKEKYNLYGQLLLTYGYAIKAGASTYDAVDIFSENSNTIKIPLDINLTAYENAEKYFKKYKKLKSAQEHISNQISIATDEINFLNDQLYYIGECKTVQDTDEIALLLTEQGYIKNLQNKKAQPVSMPHHFISSDGFDIYVGKNDKQNEYLTHKFAKKQDIWLHTKIIAGSHVIIKTNSKQVPKNTILQAAQLSAFFSKARNSQNVPIDYTTVSYVRKIRNAPIGKVTYTNYTTLYVTPDESMIKSLKTT